MSYLTYTERLIIERMYNSGLSCREIGRRICRSHVAISREVNRGLYRHLLSDTWLYQWRYSADIGQQAHDFAQTAKGRPILLGNNYSYSQGVVTALEKGISPDVFVGTKKRFNEWTVSTPTLYRCCYTKSRQIR